MIEIVELGVDLEKQGNLIAKRADQNITITFSWQHQGPAITFDATIGIGHKAVMVDPFGKLFASDGSQIGITGISCPLDNVAKSYSRQLTEPLSNHYGTDETITDGAIRVVFKIAGQEDHAGYLWNAFKITPAVAAGLAITNITVS